jgi:hypothetical protein
MKTITKYIANDNTEFYEEDKCRAYEAACAEIERIMAPLGQIPNLPACGFENGAGYLQHDKDVARAARRSLLEIANRLMPHNWFVQAITDETVHPSWPGRMISEMGNRSLDRAWSRFNCMTPDFREYGQPYYASHPEAAKNVRLN